jgi:hypothetical protein
MSFEENQRREVAPGKHTGEAPDFPPNMAALAQQLSDEADWLAGRYPASVSDRLGPTATAVAKAAQHWRSLKRFGVVSGVSAASVLVAILGWRAVTNRDSEVSDVRAPVLEQSSQVAQLNDAGGFGRQTGETIGGEENVLQGLSGAEQEAVLDLIESNAAHKTSLSI